MTPRANQADTAATAVHADVNSLDAAGLRELIGDLALRVEGVAPIVESIAMRATGDEASIQAQLSQRVTDALGRPREPAGRAHRTP
ncbi:MAG: hypothetical protein Q4G34_02405 [Micrococcus sp.]|nr:hypothetical protein [Micrococcus sp.]